MKPIDYLLVLFICWVTACTSEGIKEEIPDGYGTVVLTLKAESTIKTRTSLNSSEDIQHVSSVYLYLFNEEGLCIRMREIPWPSPGEVNYHTVTRNYSTTLPAGEYTFLAVGLDDVSGSTYQLPEAIAEGTKLTDAVLNLATGKNKEDIAHSELFAGNINTTITEGVRNMVTIDLWRRVSGVMGWFTGVPAQINGIALSRIQISLYARQNRKGYLIPQAPGNHYPFGITNPANFKDYLTDTTDGTATDRILVTTMLPENLTDTTVISGGAYVLPAAAPPVGDGSEYTLRVELIGEDNSILKTMRVQMGENDDLYISPMGSGTGIIDIGGPYRFPMVANRFYGIGSAAAPVDLGGNQDDVVITIESGWDGWVPDINLE